ncbi:MAG: isochorismatase family protein, partial [Ignavibacteriae bacterium]|nr:isochorismatase family protein [Ignavibacteriota bacterium]
IVDIQERIISVMRKHESLIENVVKLVKGIKVLNIPIFYTEQYPKGLGNTVAEIKNELSNDAINKLSFSCSGAGDLFPQLEMLNIKNVIVCGVESHVCVQQTVLDLLANEFKVYLPINAISSRRKIDYKTAVTRMEKHGAEITTIESVLFELLEICGTKDFKAISSIIK